MNYAARQAKVGERYPEGAYVEDPTNIAYLCGHHLPLAPGRPCRLELPAAGPVRLVLNRIYAGFVGTATWYFDGERPQAPPSGWASADDFVRELRSVKDEEELQRLRGAADLSVWGQEAYRDILRPGESFLEVRFEVARRLAAEATRRDPRAHWDLRVGGEAGPSSARPYAPVESGRPLRVGDVVVAVVIIGKDGYYAECERTYLIGEPSARTRAVFAAMVEAHAAAIAACVPGLPVAGIDRASREVLAAAGLDQFILHRAGHGIGLSPQEVPLDSPANTSKFSPTTVMALEPGLYLPGIGGFRHSDTVVAGPEILTPFPRDLDAVTLPG